MFVGKFPHLVASVSGSRETSEQASSNEAVLNFGEVAVQNTATKWIELHNFSPVSVALNNFQLPNNGHFNRGTAL